MPRSSPLRAVVLSAALLLSAACTAEPGAAPSASAPPPSSVPAPVAPLSFRDCADGFECAELPVPAGERDVDLAVVRRPAQGDRLGVLVVNPGGPGASAVEYLRLAHGSLPERVRTRFDVVAFDPRGVGRSSPVDCGGTAELDAYFALDPTPDDDGELTALVEGQEALARACQERSGDLLPHVSTVDAAADLDRLREALGEEQVSYLGYSYGTSIGLAYLERFPQRVRAMVLDGAIDPSLAWDGLLEGQARGFDAALRAFLEDCAAEGCAFLTAVDGPAPLPSLLAAFDALRARVDARPLPAGDRRLGPGEFDIGVVSGLYDRAHGWPALAEALAAAARDGDGEQLLALADLYLERGPEGYSPVTESNLAVVCLDRPWPDRLQPYLDLAERLRATDPRFGPPIALSALACASWPVEPTGEPAPAVAPPGAPPVLVVGTTGDPATPYAWSQAVADQLATGVLLTHVGEGHTVYRAGAPACVLEVVDAYLLTAQEPATTRC